MWCNEAVLTLAIVVPEIIHLANGFQISRPTSRSRSRSSALHRRDAFVNPSDLVQQALDSPLIGGAPDHASTVDQLGSLLSTMYTTGVAHGHDNPWFGPPDPFLEAGKSIAPPGVNMPALSSDLPKFAQDMSSRGVNVMDGSRFTPEPYLPGAPASSASLTRDSASAPTLDAFVAKAEWSSNFVKVLDKLPTAAFVYCLVEFFFLRPNVDLYKSEIEQESPTSLWAETLATFAVRLVAMGFITFLTLVMFG